MKKILNNIAIILIVFCLLIFIISYLSYDLNIRFHLSNFYNLIIPYLFIINISLLAYSSILFLKKTDYRYQLYSSLWLLAVILLVWQLMAIIVPGGSIGTGSI